MQLIKFSRREGRVKESPTCPDWTFFSGYTMDSWQKWRIDFCSLESAVTWSIEIGFAFEKHQRDSQG
ncbi:hypothetical protein CHARACLAT_030606 [Characodon lateralis]|uniref:Uncharacterized protein n=1 Tax=Characodon lateralis TaxID=208331 RepID=A0ABU7E932_9TELE|nr:hypothetical protein [Characodon lateralis]